MSDKPIECSECKKKASVHYTEIIGNSVTRFSVCPECPILRKRLHENLQPSDNVNVKSEKDLCCNSCGTTLENIHMGHQLGCAQCYDVFPNVLFIDAGHKLGPLQLNVPNNSKQLHIGRVPGKKIKSKTSVKLLALNEALNETLLKEDYEQAAWLRDQIKIVMNKNKKR